MYDSEFIDNNKTNSDKNLSLSLSNSNNSNNNITELTRDIFDNKS